MDPVHSALGAAHARDADLPLRRTGIHRIPVDLRDEPGVSMPELARIRGILAKRSLSWWCRTSTSPRRPRSPTSCSRQRAGAKRPGLSRTSTGSCTSPKGGRPAGGGPQRPRHLPRLFAPDGVPDAGRRAAAGPGRGRRTLPGLEGMRPRRPCDYTGISYERLRGAAASRGRATRAPGRKERLYDGRGLPHRAGLLRKLRPRPADRRHGRGAGASAPGGAAAHPESRGLHPPHEEPDERYPLRYTTGRTAYHFHTRTKTGRSSPADAPRRAPGWKCPGRRRRGSGSRKATSSGSTSPRGAGSGSRPASATSEPGTVFAPFHYGYWDPAAARAPPTAANELTITEWDPVSKQPVFKNAAVKVEKIGDATGPAPAPSTVGVPPVRRGRERRWRGPPRAARTGQATERLGAAPPPRFPEAIGRGTGRHAMNLDIYLGMLHQAEQTLPYLFRQVAEGHGAEPDVHHLCHTLARQCEEHSRQLLPVVQRLRRGSFRQRTRTAPRRRAFHDSRHGPVGLLRDLQDLYLLASFVDVTWTMVKQAGSALRDRELLDVVNPVRRRNRHPAAGGCRPG